MTNATIAPQETPIEPARRKNCWLCHGYQRVRIDSEPKGMAVIRDCPNCSHSALTHELIRDHLNDVGAGHRIALNQFEKGDAAEAAKKYRPATQFDPYIEYHRCKAVVEMLESLDFRMKQIAEESEPVKTEHEAIYMMRQFKDWALNTEHEHSAAFHCGIALALLESKTPVNSTHQEAMLSAERLCKQLYGTQQSQDNLAVQVEHLNNTIRQSS